MIRRRRPALVIRLELEAGQGAILLDCDSHEDELRLRAWLRRSAALRVLPAVLDQLLDALDERDRRRAA